MEFYAPSARAHRCAYCQNRTYWLAYDDDDDGKWIPVCKPGHGCGVGVEEYVDIGDLSSANGVSLALAMDRVSRGFRRIEVIVSSARTTSGDHTPVAEIDGVSKTLAEWARANNIKYQTIRKRHLNGHEGQSLIGAARRKSKKA